MNEITTKKDTSIQTDIESILINNASKLESKKIKTELWHFYNTLRSNKKMVQFLQQKKTSNTERLLKEKIIYIFKSVLKRGLSFAKEKNHVYLVPQKTGDLDCRVQYQGLIKQVTDVLKSKEIKIIQISSDVIFEGDKFTFTKDTKIEHSFSLPRGKKILGAYATIKLDANTYQNVFVDYDELEQVYHSSEYGIKQSLQKCYETKGGITFWVKWTIEMIKKTVLRKLLKILIPQIDEIGFEETVYQENIEPTIDYIVFLDKVKEISQKKYKETIQFFKLDVQNLKMSIDSLELHEKLRLENFLLAYISKNNSDNDSKNTSKQVNITDDTPVDTNNSKTPDNNSNNDNKPDIPVDTNNSKTPNLYDNAIIKALDNMQKTNLSNFVDIIAKFELKNNIPVSLKKMKQNNKQELYNILIHEKD